MIPVSIATHWISSVAYVAALSLLGTRIWSLVGGVCPRFGCLAS